MYAIKTADIALFWWLQSTQHDAHKRTSLMTKTMEKKKSHNMARTFDWQAKIISIFNLN